MKVVAYSRTDFVYFGGYKFSVRSKIIDLMCDRYTILTGDVIYNILYLGDKVKIYFLYKECEIVIADNKKKIIAVGI